jgi:hypothetical protein
MQPRPLALTSISRHARRAIHALRQAPLKIVQTSLPAASRVAACARCWWLLRTRRCY